MLLRTFKGTDPGVILLIIITLVAVWVSAILNQRLHPRFIYESDPMPLYALLKGMINNSHNIGVVLSFLLVSLMSFLMVVDGDLLPRYGRLPSRRSRPGDLRRVLLRDPRQDQRLHGRVRRAEPRARTPRGRGAVLGVRPRLQRAPRVRRSQACVEG